MQNMVLKKEDAARKKGLRYISLWKQTHGKNGNELARPNHYTYHHEKNQWKKRNMAEKTAWIQRRRNAIMNGSETFVPNSLGGLPPKKRKKLGEITHL